MARAGIPVVDIAPLLDPAASSAAVTRTAEAIRVACSGPGALQIIGHGIDPVLRRRLLDASVDFFTLEESEKDRIAMRHGGAAWRGWFPVGAELTDGVPDAKEGVYFGTDLPGDDPRVRAGVPLHGPNLYPRRPEQLREVVPEWMDRVTVVGRAVLSGIAVSLGLERNWFDRWCAEPTVLFRIFHYPPAPRPGRGWGVAEHTDYGLLTLLVQDDTAGLEVRVEDEWVEVEPLDDAIVCNLGDMLDRMTGGRLRSTPHRVRPPERDRYSFPLFLDPAFDAQISPLPGSEPTERARLEAAHGRWDGRSVDDLQGPYGDYLVDRVSRVFPELFDQVTTDEQRGSDPR